MVVTKEGVGSCYTGIALEEPMRIQTPGDSGRRGVWRRGWCLAANTKQISDKVTVDQMRSVGEKYGEVIPHIEHFIQKELFKHA